MNKFHKLLMGTTAIVSMFGWNVNMAQAQSQSRTTYRCYRDSEGTTRLKPSVPGSVIETGGCYIPVSFGRCVAAKSLFNFRLSGAPSNPSGFDQCTTVSPRIVEDPATSKKYYYLKDGVPGSSLTGVEYGTGVILQK
ncbi:hypothetical protein [Dolichospermum sp. UHCC 0259]|uniref:hypothetical protein n=1 Tax=Dolichospermum sp. UHCC 0259 TaxID=2590010 RepID=UPI0014451D25|nr:hypothetical protein [Dolichospermum sp. UHCC 0259]MTJ49183.1 hypothetical protein [Dolichospermum sp. UHCC 0259]